MPVFTTVVSSPDGPPRMSVAFTAVSVTLTSSTILEAITAEIPSVSAGTGVPGKLLSEPGTGVLVTFSELLKAQTV